MTSCSSKGGDLAGRCGSFFFAWGLPFIGVLASAATGFHLELAWPVCFGWMGAACLLNARKCGRLHCFLTGPLFLAAAMASVLHGFSLVDFGAHGWEWIGNTALIGGLLLTWLPEKIWGTYASGHSREGGSGS